MFIEQTALMKHIQFLDFCGGFIQSYGGAPGYLSWLEISNEIRGKCGIIIELDE